MKQSVRYRRLKPDDTICAGDLIYIDGHRVMTTKARTCGTPRKYANFLQSWRLICGRTDFSVSVDWAPLEDAAPKNGSHCVVYRKKKRRGKTKAKWL